MYIFTYLLVNRTLRFLTRTSAIIFKLKDVLYLEEEECGVPQSYVLGPRLYCIFAKPISEICRRHNFSHHSYADDTQVYLVIKPLDNWKNISRRLETCLSDVSVLMSSTMLKLNQDKTELIVFAPKHHVNEFSECCLSFDYSNQCFIC